MGGPDQLLRTTCRVEDVRYVAGMRPSAPFSAGVKIRSHAPEAAALITPLGDQARIDFDVPQRALAPGQAIVSFTSMTRPLLVAIDPAPCLLRMID